MPETMEHQSTEPRIIQGKTGDEFLADLRQREMHEAAEAWQVVMEFSREVEHRGGLVLVAGGTVRDELMGLSVKDFDLEVYHLPPEEIEELAAQYGKVKQDVGRAFPMLKLWFGKSQIDIGSPRRDRKMSDEHTGYISEAVPNMSVADAVQRRDFTINALMKNPLNGEILDYVGGTNDIEQKVLRAVDHKRFTEDALRILRGVQFVGRFGLTVEPATMALMKDTVPVMKKKISRERFWMEWEKLLVKADKPSTGFELARGLDIFSDYPEIQKMKDTPQDKEHHPEGDVWKHSMMVVDGAARIAVEQQLSDKERQVVIGGAFGHDVGKVATTVEESGRIHSKGHEEAGIEPMHRWMTDQGFPDEVMNKVLPIIREHMHPTDLYKADQQQELGTGPIRRIARRLHPATIKELLVVCEADHFGRDLPTTDFPAGPWLLEQAAKLHLEEKKPEPIIRGRDLLALGYKQGLVFGKIIQAAEKLAEEKSMTGPEIMEHVKKHKNPEDALVELESLSR